MVVAAAVALLSLTGEAARQQVLTVPLILSVVLLSVAPASPFATRKAIALSYGAATVAGTLGSLPESQVLPAAAAVGVVVAIGTAAQAIHPPACALGFLLATRPTDLPVIATVAVSVAVLLALTRVARWQSLLIADLVVSAAAELR